LKNKTTKNEPKKRQASIYEHFGRPKAKKNKLSKNQRTMTIFTSSTVADDPFGIIDENDSDEAEAEAVAEAEEDEEVVCIVPRRRISAQRYGKLKGTRKSPVFDERVTKFSRGDRRRNKLVNIIDPNQPKIDQYFPIMNELQLLQQQNLALRLSMGKLTASMQDLATNESSNSLHSYINPLNPLLKLLLHAREKRPYDPKLKQYLLLLFFYAPDVGRT
jgi:hypothetical protein